MRPSLRSAPPSSNFLPLLASLLFPIPYFLGVFAALALRFAPRRTRPEMPRVEGIFRPHIVIPVGLDPVCAAMAHAHEEAHVRRRDPLWSLVADLVCAGLWFAPPVWLCARAMRAESEVACDAATLATGASRTAYARLLLAHAGPAPANALGGPARRLARRILMLERNPKPLSRPLAGGLLALGLVALLPWRAAGQPVPEPAAREAVPERIPARLPLRAAGLRLLRKPEVQNELRLSPAQRETLKGRTYAGNLRLLESRKRDALSNLKKFPVGSRDPMAQATRIELRNVTKEEAETRRKLAKTRMTPLSEPQSRRLAVLALDRFGSALWEDPAVASALGLTPGQIAAARSQNDAIVRAMEEDRSAGEFAYVVGNLQSELQRKDATPARRKQIERQIQGYREIAARFRPIDQAKSPEFWRMRGAADVRLEGALTPGQRDRLDALRRTPSAWPSAPTFNEKSARNSDRPASTLPNHAKSADPIKEIMGKDGTGWRIYRRSSDHGLYRYEAERVKPAPPIFKAPSRRSTQPTLPHPSLSRWSDLIIDGPPAGAEPGNVPIGVAHGPHGSVWTVYRSRQSAPYTYAVEHSSTESTQELTRMLDYRTGEITAKLRRHVLSERLPSTLTIDGKVWTIHPPASKGPPFPSSVEPLDHYAPGYEPGTKGYAKERRRFAAKPPIIWAEPWTEAAIRRHLHLQDGESLDFRPDPDRPDEDVASLTDREGIIDRNIVHRRRKADGTFTYRVQAVIFVKTKAPKP